MGWLSKRLHGVADDESLAIPPGTAVDPALFPEDEYPVECLGCGYALRGLPDGRCPECGREFTRAVSLVETYYYCNSDRRTRVVVLAEVLLSMGLCVLAVSLLGLGGSLLASLGQYDDPNADLMPGLDWQYFFRNGFIPFGLAFLVLGILLGGARPRIDRSKRAAIKAALWKQTIETAATKPGADSTRGAE